MKPIDRFLYWIKERHSIFEKKEAGEPKPWTDDPILQKYRFCNVHRENDRETRWIAKNWRDPNRDDPLVWFAMVVARWVNWNPSLQKVGYPIPWHPRPFVRIMHAIQMHKEKAFTGAYMISASSKFQGSKAEYIAERVFQPMWDNRVEITDEMGGTLRQAYECLVQFNAVGSFMAGQVIADVKYTPLLQDAEDWYSFAVPGPGSRRGLNRLIGRDKDTKWKSEKQWWDVLTTQRIRCAKSIHKANVPKIHAQDFQNCLCEFDKYERVRLGEGKPRSRYDGV